MYKKLMSDMDKTTLLKMREEGMSNQEIADALACGYSTVLKLIGKQPKEITSASCRAVKVSRGSGVVKMKSFMHGEEPEPEEPAPAVLVMKPVKMPIPLRGEFMHYVISPDRDLIDVETEGGRALIQIPAEKLDTFIAELNAIKKNIGAAQPMQSWG